MSFYDKLKFDANGLIPAIIQEQKTGRVLMMAWMNRASLEKTIATGKTHFWSRSRQKFWMKGESSGHTQAVKDIAFDCDGDTLLIQVEQIGAACHEGYQSCFFRSVAGRRRELQDHRSAARNARSRFTARRSDGRVRSIRQPQLTRCCSCCCWCARGMDFLSTWVATPNLVLEGNPIAKKLGWKMGHSAQPRALLRLRLLAAAGDRHQHHQRAGGRAQFPIRLADALAGRAALPRLARRARAGNQRHALPVLPVCPDRADRRAWARR